MKEYSWNFNGDAECWHSDTFDTVAECLANARRENELDGNQYTAVYIGRNVPFVPWVNVESVLDDCQEQAADETGQVGHDWDAYDYKKKDELEELQTVMDAALHDWMRKYGYYPEIYSVNAIKRYELAVEGEKT